MTRQTVLLLALLSTLTACGGDAAASGEPVAADTPAAPAAPEAAAPAPATSGCPWLTSENASGLLGAAVTVTGDGVDHCDIASEPNTFRARIDVDPEPLGNTLETILSAYENTAGYGARQPISGLGDQAAWVGHAYPAGGYGGLLLGVEQGGRTVSLNLSPSPPREDLPAKAEALARAIVAQM